MGGGKGGILLEGVGVGKRDSIMVVRGGEMYDEVVSGNARSGADNSLEF